MGFLAGTGVQFFPFGWGTRLSPKARRVEHRSCPALSKFCIFIRGKSLQSSSVPSLGSTSGTGDPGRVLVAGPLGPSRNWPELPTTSVSAYPPPNQHLPTSRPSLAQFFLGKLPLAPTPPLPQRAARSKLLATGRNRFQVSSCKVSRADERHFQICQRAKSRSLPSDCSPRSDDD